MKLKLRFESFDFQYKKPIPVKKWYVRYNQALVVYASADGKEEAVIHLTSLPHFHDYNILEWKFALEDFFSSEDLNFNHIELSSPFFNTTNARSYNESELLFVIESVLFAFIEKNFIAALASIPKTDIKINGLYSKELGLEEIPECLKIKIRPGDEKIFDTIQLMKDLVEKKSTIRFRLDGNRTFDLVQMIQLAHQLEKNHLLHLVEYIEEPFKNFSDIYQFQKISSIPLALDESVVPFIDRPDQFPDFFFILKPSLVGLSTCFKLAKHFGNKIIISSSFELPTCFRSFLYLAALNPDQYHGLDTLKYLPNKYTKEAKTFLLSF